MVEGTGEARLADLPAVVDLMAQVTYREGTRGAIVTLLGRDTRLCVTDHPQMGMHACAKVQHLAS